MADRLTEPVMVRLTPEDYAALLADAEEQERTVAQTVRLAVKRYLATKIAAEGDALTHSSAETSGGGAIGPPSLSAATNPKEPHCPGCGQPLTDATGDWQCHRCQRLWPRSYFAATNPKEDG